MASSGLMAAVPRSTINARPVIAAREKQADEREIHAVLPRIDDPWIATHLQREKSERPDNKSDSSQSSQYHRNAEICIRRFPSEEIVIDRGH